MKRFWILDFRFWIIACGLLVAYPVQAEGIGAGEQGLRGQGDKGTRGQDARFTPLVFPSLSLPLSNIPQPNKIKQLSTSASELLAQEPTQAQVAQVTAVQLKPKPKGLEVILETATEFPEVLTSSSENSLITDIPNAQLRLPKGGAFRQDNPTKDIVSVEVTNLDAKTLRVTVTGKAGVPTAEVSQSPQALILSVAAPPAPAPSAPPATPAQPTPAPAPEQQAPPPPAPEQKPQAEEAPVDLTLTAEEEAGGYNVPDTTTATKTDTPLRDIPQSIQVVPEQVLEDRKVTNLTEAVETVSGVVDGSNFFGTPTGARIIRGFRQEGNLRNGYRDVDYYALTGVGTIERVEVLKGPASVLFGAMEPGGIINVVTKQPLSEPYYKFEFEAGNREFYQPGIDLSGPLNVDETALYRFNASYQSSDGFQEFVNTDLTTIAPTFTFKLGDRTDLNLYYEYINLNGIPEGYNSLLSDGSLVPRSFYQGYPGFTSLDFTTQKFGYTLNHKFSDNWQIRNNFSGFTNRQNDEYAIAFGIIDDRFLSLIAQDNAFKEDNYFGQIDLLGKFNTGSISHQLLVGFDFNRNSSSFDRNQASVPNLDILNPNYNVPRPDYVPLLRLDDLTQSYGVFLQDQVNLLDNLKLLIGGRFDWISQKTDTAESDPQTQNDFAFSPRIGLVYQPSELVALYASYSQSFNSTFGFNPSGEAFEPTKGNQYEVGVKSDLLDGKLSATLAAYQITKANVTTPDPDPELAAEGFSIQTGEQRSRGIELDVAGEILPGWKVIGSYAYTNAEVTEDNAIPVGNQVANVPKNQASLWTTYELQEGNLQGLGFGLGLFYVGEREGDLDNSFTLGDYFRTDAALYYRRNNYKVALNIRNLFDTDYIRASDGGSLYLQRGAPLTITGSISWEF